MGTKNRPSVVQYQYLSNLSKGAFPIRGMTQIMEGGFFVPPAKVESWGWEMQGPDNEKHGWVNGEVEMYNKKNGQLKRHKAEYDVYAEYKKGWAIKDIRKTGGKIPVFGEKENETIKESVLQTLRDKDVTAKLLEEIYPNQEYEIQRAPFPAVRMPSIEETIERVKDFEDTEYEKGNHIDGYIIGENLDKNKHLIEDVEFESWEEEGYYTPARITRDPADSYPAEGQPYTGGAEVTVKTNGDNLYRVLTRILNEDATEESLPGKVIVQQYNNNQWVESGSIDTEKLGETGEFYTNPPGILKNTKGPEQFRIVMNWKWEKQWPELETI
jgi:hypothetical protein